MTSYYLTHAKLLELFGNPIKETFAPTETRKLPWTDIAEGETVPAAIAAPRAAQSTKGFFMPAAESMGQYGPDGKAGTALEAKPLVLVGVRACELRARNYLDKVMREGEFEDPRYCARRDSMTIVACDCVDCTESCCCTLVGGKPFATEGYDVNLTPLEDGMIAEAATDRGREWLGDTAGLSEATSEQLARRDKLRNEMIERLGKQNAAFTFSATDDNPPKLPLEDDPSWQKFAADCVECGACTNICPTCYCFYLYDQVLGPEQFERLRTWDSCLFSTYHRMAGGVSMKLSARPKLYSRLANRVLHKFVYSPQQYGMLGCVGCGRCIDACPGAIDIRQVVTELKE